MLNGLKYDPPCACRSQEFPILIQTASGCNFLLSSRVRNRAPYRLCPGSARYTFCDIAMRSQRMALSRIALPNENIPWRNPQRRS